MTLRPAVLAVALVLAAPAWGQSYPAPSYQSVTILADPSATTQAARKSYVDAADGLRILTSSLGQPNGPAQLGGTGLLPVTQGGTGAGTPAAALAALGGVPVNNPSLTGLLTVGAAGTVFLADPALDVQINATAGMPAYFAANKAGAAGLAVGYDASAPAAVIRVSTADPLNITVNGTTLALQVTSDGNARFPLTVTATTLRVGSTTGPTWTTGTAAPTSAQPVGSIYSRVGGGLGSTLYVSRGLGLWAAVGGV